MQSASEHAIPASNAAPPLTTENAAAIAPVPHCAADLPHRIAAPPHSIKSLFPVLLLLPFTALGFFLAWLLDSSSVLLGQKPDRTTQVLMVLMCIGPAAALVIFRALKPEEKQH
jgi:hypothetical protein